MSAQTQMMNAMFMAMLNKNGGDSSNPPSSPSNTWKYYNVCVVTMFVDFYHY
jgi:hypothetical protein